MSTLRRLRAGATAGYPARTDPGNGCGLRPTVAGHLLAAALLAAGAAAAQPLEVSPANPRYFAGPGGEIVVLAGSHSWGVLQDPAAWFTQIDWWGDPAINEDNYGYLDHLADLGHNFVRLWHWEQASFYSRGEPGNTFRPVPYPRTAECCALDGENRFDLAAFDEAYFAELADRVAEAEARGIYVGVMLFNGWSVETKGGGGSDSSGENPWDGHPYHRANNVNGVDGDPDVDGEGLELHEPGAALDPWRRAWVEKVVDTLWAFDNVLWEVANEAHAGSLDWQAEVVDHLRDYELATWGVSHPIGITAIEGLGNDELWAGPADWISPNSADFNDPDEPYASDMPATDGTKVELLDTDHIGYRMMYQDPALGLDWVWKALTRGYHLLSMDPLPGSVQTDATNPGERHSNGDDPGWDAHRAALGHALDYAGRIELATAVPQERGTTSPSTTGFCLFTAGDEYLVYQPEPGAALTVRQLVPDSNYDYEWFDAAQGVVVETGTIFVSGAQRNFTPPVAERTVLLLERWTEPPVPDAAVDSHTLPARLEPGEAYTAEVTMRNTGTATWTESLGFELGLVDDEDPFRDGNQRIDLPPGAAVLPGKVHAFSVDLVAPGEPGHYLTDWRMVQAGGAGWFGEIAESWVEVGDPAHFLLLGPDPGEAGVVNTLSALFAGAGATVRFLASAESGGSVEVPGCPGLFVDLASPVLLGTGVADGDGTATLEIELPPALAGRQIAFQAVDVAGCEASGLVEKQFSE